MSVNRTEHLLAEIDSLNAKVLEANQCAARALEGRDAAFSQLQEAEGSRSLRDMVNQLQTRLSLTLKAHAYAEWKNKKLKAEINLVRAEMAMAKAKRSRPSEAGT